MRPRYLAIAAVVFGVSASTASQAYEERNVYERDATRSERQRVEKALRALGYRSISDVDVVGGRFEADAVSPSGREVDVYLDRRTLKIIRARRS